MNKLLNSNYMREAGGNVTAPCPDSGEGRVPTPLIQAPLSQQ